MNKIRILYMIPTLKACGPVNILYGIIKNLDRQKFDIHIVTLVKEPRCSRYEDFLKLNIQIHTSKYSRINSIVLGNRHVKKIVDKLNPDIIHSHGFRPDIISSKYNNKITFSTIHNYPHLDYMMTYGKLKGYFMYKKHINILNKIDYPIACSKSISNELLNEFGLETYFIQNGVDNEKFKYKYINSEKLKHDYKIPEGKKIILSVGVLNKRKNPLKIIKSFKDANMKQNYILILLGDGELMEECLRLKDDSIFLLGNVRDVHPFLCISDIFISASNGEGLPNAVLEAMSCSLPVVLSDINPHREILEYDNESGILFNESKECLVEILKNINKINLEQAGKKAELVVSENFTDIIMSKKYETKYILSMQGDIN